MELQKAAGEVELSQLKQRVHEQETLLAKREAQLEMLEEEVAAQQKVIDELNFQKSQLERDIQQYEIKLELAFKAKAVSEEELSHTKQLIDQSEAKWSLAQRRLNIEEYSKGELQSEENGRAQQTLEFNSQVTIASQPQASLIKDESMMSDVLQQQLNELVLVQKRAEMAEENAQSYKTLLDDSNNRVKKLQMDLETERINTSQKTDEFQQETLNMKKSINELQEEIRSLQRTKSSLEQNTYFQNTEVEGLKEQLKIIQRELHKKSSTEQENSYKINNLEEELASKQAEMDQLKFKCNELTRINVSSDGDIQGLQIQMESMERERSFCEQKIKSLKSEMENWKQQLQAAKEENIQLKRSEQATQLKCKNIEAELQNSELLVSQLQKKVHELKLLNMEMENNLKKVRAKHDQVMMEIDSKDQQIKIFKSQVESAKSQLRIFEEELNKKSQASHELQIRLQDYSEDTKKIAELQQKIKALNSNIVNYEQEIKNQKLELKSVLVEKNLANQKVQMQNAEINDLNLMLKKKNAEIEETKESKTLHLETELHKNKVSVDVMSSSDKLRSNLQHENLILKRERAEALEKNVSLGAEVRALKEKLQRAEMETEQKKKENSVLHLRAQQMEEQLEKCKKMLDELKSKLELQKEGYDEQLLLVQNEIEKKIVLLQSDNKSNQHSAELSEMLNKYFRKDVTQIKTVSQTTTEAKLHLDRLQQEKTKLTQDLSKAKSQTTQLEAEKLTLNLKINALQSLCNEHSKESAKVKQLLTDAEWKLRLKETDEKCLREQIDSYVKEVKSLQEKLLSVEVVVNRQKVSETSDFKDSMTASPVASSYQDTKSKMEDEIRKKKVSSQVWIKSV